MKLLLLTAFLFIYGCSERQKTIKTEDNTLSSVQRNLQTLADSFKIEYQTQTTQLLKDSTVYKYQKKLYILLSENYIDSIKVHMDSLIVNGWTVVAKSHCNRDIAFQSSLTFVKGMDKNADSIFRFSKNLKPGSDTTLHFSYMGYQDINDPTDTTVPTFIIYAYPSLKLFGNK